MSKETVKPCYESVDYSISLNIQNEIVVEFQVFFCNLNIKDLLPFRD